MGMRLVGFVLLGLGPGCAEYSANSDSAGSDAAPSTPAPIDEPDGDSDTAAGSDSGTLPEAAYYGIDLRFQISGSNENIAGSWQDESTVLSIDQWTAARELLCTQTVPVLAVTEAAYPDIRPDLFGWWRIETAEAVVDPACPSWTAQDWHLGIGPYDPRLDPMLAQRGMLAFDVYALYLQEEPDGLVFVIGYAGTDAMIQGQTGLTVDSSPLPDGSYLAESVVLMSLR